MTVNIKKKRRYTVSRIQRAVTNDIPAKRSTCTSLYIMLTAITAAGILTGVYSFGTGMGGTVQTSTSADMLTVFADRMIIMGVYILLCFAGGFSAAGGTGAVLLCIFKGIGAGYLAGQAFSAPADITAIARIIPYEAMSTAVTVMAARESIRMSRVICSRGLSDDGSDIKLYTRKFAVLAAFALFTAFAAAVLSQINFT